MPRRGRSTGRWLLVVSFVSLVFCGWKGLQEPWFAITTVLAGIIAALICRHICIVLAVDDWHEP